jgi:hypothetical protein
MKNILLIATFILFLNNINAQTRRQSTERDNKNGIVLTTGGVAFTTAAFLEGPQNYGTWKHNPNSTSQYNMTYVTPSFWQQTPRNIMFVAGVSVTITGLISCLSKR